jgi:hypothetical protein
MVGEGGMREEKGRRVEASGDFFTLPSSWGETELGVSSRPTFVTATIEN